MGTAAANTETIYWSFIAARRDFWRMLRRKDDSRFKNDYSQSKIAMRGCKQMPMFVKIEEGKVDKPTFDQYVPAHKAYIQELIAKGHKARTGYWVEQRGGMLLFEAASRAEAEAIVASDPLVQHGCVNYQLYEWRIVME